ncbi:hypothetical protein IGA_01740, partial [Bacillus cereus HuA3-9]
DGTLYAMKVARTVLSGGKDGDNFKVLPIATNREGNNDDSMGQASIPCIKVIILLQRGQF